jgi:hypothetical protein
MSHGYFTAAARQGINNVLGLNPRATREPRILFASLYVERIFTIYIKYLILNERLIRIKSQRIFKIIE